MSEEQGWELVEIETDWSTVLGELYNGELIPSFGDTRRSAVEDAAEIIAARTNLEPVSVKRTLGHLAHIGLVQIEENEDDIVEESENYPTYGVWLTKEGFKVAHEREMSNRQEDREDSRIEQQNEVNRAIGLLTLGLVFTTLVDTVTQSANLTLVDYSLIGVNVVVVLVIVIALYQTGVLTGN